MLLKEFRRERSWLILRYYPGMCLKRLAKTRNTFARISGLRAEMWGRDFRIRSRSSNYRAATSGRNNQNLK